jgi:predicted Zn-dependent protease
MKITPNQFAWIFVLLLASLIGWGVYAAVCFFKTPSLDFFSVENEIKFGEMIESQSINESNGFIIVQNHFVDSVIHEISLRLQEGLQRSNYTYQMKVVQNEDPNAFAIPGGKIFIHSGLIQFCNSPEELAAIIAHEMGHVEHRHSINQLVKQFGVSALISYFTDGGANVTSTVSQELLSTMFSREDESEADDFALALLAKSGINPALLGEVFQRMKSDYNEVEGSLSLLSTHPSMDERTEKSKAYQVNEVFIERRFNMDWNKVKQHMKGDTSLRN